jgi:hypothetical protein
MAGLVPAIHVGTRIEGSSLSRRGRRETCWSSETAAPCHDVDARHKAGHDADNDDQTPDLLGF